MCNLTSHIIIRNVVITEQLLLLMFHSRFISGNLSNELHTKAVSLRWGKCFPGSRCCWGRGRTPSNAHSHSYLRLDVSGGWLWLCRLLLVTLLSTVDCESKEQFPQAGSETGGCAALFSEALFIDGVCAEQNLIKQSLQATGRDELGSL